MSINYFVERVQFDGLTPGPLRHASTYRSVSSVGATQSSYNSLAKRRLLANDSKSTPADDRMVAKFQ